MKNLLTVFLLLIAGTTFGQEPNGAISARSYQNIQDSLFQHLDKSKITTGVLYDRAFHWEDAAAYKAGDTLDFDRAMQIYYEFYLSTYNSASLKSTDTIREHALLRQLTENVVPVGFINYAYEEIDTAAYTDGRLIIRAIDSLVEDGNGATPYNTHRLVVPVAFTDKLLDSFATFYFDPALTLENEGGSAVSAIKLENFRGEEIVLTPNSQGSLQIFPSVYDNNAYLKSTILFANGTSIGSWIKLSQYAKTTKEVLNSKSGICTNGIELLSSGPNLKFKGYDEFVATEATGQIKKYYRLDKNNPAACVRRIIKPIIILDGYDAENKERPDPDYVYNLLYYNDSTKHLGLELREKGYDVIILNFPQYTSSNGKAFPLNATVTRDGGTDYIERNAMVLIKLIQDVNAELQANGSTEKVVVMGPSMGGQISRYALKYMENNNMNHNTRMWVAFDSPNLGANIPLSLQISLWYGGYVGGNEGAKRVFEKSVRSIASQQLLIYQSGPNRYNNANGLALLPTLDLYEPKRATWQNMIDNLGYPNGVRRIAITNGAQISSSEPSCSDILHYTIKLNSWPNTGKTVFEIHPKTMAISTGYNCRLFDGSINGVHDTYDLPITNTNNEMLPYYQGDLDGAPGGLYDAAKQLKDSLTYDTKGFQVFTYITARGTPRLEVNGADYHCFIPTVSSLGLYQHNFSWRTLLDVHSTFCNNGTPFHNVYVPPTNEAHVKVTQANVDFLIGELDFSGTITGPDYPTACSKSLYTLNAPLPAGSTVSWSATGSLFLDLQPLAGTNYVLVRPRYAGVGPSGASATITATITYPNCTKREVSFTTKGTTSANYSLDFTGLPNCNWQASVFPTTPPLANNPANLYIPTDSYQWSETGVLYSAPNSSPTYIPINSSGYIPGTGGQIWVKISPAVCHIGGSTTINLTKVFNKTTSGCDPDPDDPNNSPFRLAPPIESNRVEAFPNPSTSDWRLIITSPKAQNIEATLKDAAGKTLWSKRTSEGISGIPIVPGEGLSAGVYFLYLRIEGVAHQLKLVKQ